MATEEIIIDGAMGEGGGQIVRSAMALSLVTGRRARIERVRAGRAKPGLLRQHLTAAAATQAIGATVEGAHLGSTTLVVDPGEIRGGEYHFKISSAGSACLVLQTVLPALIAARQSAEIVLEGGTHNPFAPPFDYVERVFAPVLGRMGVSLQLELTRRGFYPAGGGRFTARLDARDGVQPIEILTRGEIRYRMVTAIVANIAGGIARREVDTVIERLGWTDDCWNIVQDEESPGPGNIVMIEVGDGSTSELISGVGEKRLSAEKVANRACGRMTEYLDSSAPVGRHLADQLILPFAVAGGGAFRTLPLSDHARTNLAVLDLFAPGIARARTDEGTTIVEFDSGIDTRWPSRDSSAERSKKEAI